MANRAVKRLAQLKPVTAMVQAVSWLNCSTVTTNSGFRNDEFDVSVSWNERASLFLNVAKDLGVFQEVHGTSGHEGSGFCRQVQAI